MARIDAAAIHFEPQWVTPADVVDAAVGAGPARARRTSRCASSADEQTEVEIDPRVASVALSHLLENAAQYSPRAIARSRSRPRSQPDGLHVSVTDHGPGPRSGRAGPPVRALLSRARRPTARHPARAWGSRSHAGCWRPPAAGSGRENVPGAGARFTIVVPGPIAARRGERD